VSIVANSYMYDHFSVVMSRRGRNISS